MIAAPMLALVLAAEPVVGGYTPGKGLGFATRDGRYSISVRARLQPRLEVEREVGGSSEAVPMMRRARLTIAGTVFSKTVRYYIQLGFTPRDMTGGLRDDVPDVRHNPLRDARIELTRFRDAELWVGQTKVPFSRQRVISDGNLAAIDRSIANEEFNLDRDVGVQLRSQDLGGVHGKLGYALGVFTGDGRNSFEVRKPELLYVARFEVRPLGPLADDGESDQARSRKPKLALGVAYAFHDEAQGDRGVFGARPPDRGTTDYHNATADLALHWRGVSLESGVHWRVGRRHAGDVRVPIAPARNGLGWFAQLAWLLPKTSLEPVVRYAQVHNVYGAHSSIGDGIEAGGGLGYYFAGHDLKVQADYYRLWHEGIGSDRLRVQLQVAF